MSTIKKYTEAWLALIVAVFLCGLILLPAKTHAAEVPIRETDVATAADGNAMVLVEGNYVYLSKTDILKRINEIRLEACNEGVQDPRDKTRALTPSDYVPIKWSSDLEWIAQLRACEATVHMDHGRPNGGRWSGVSHNGLKSSAEDIAWNGSASIIGGINQWYGEKADWVNQTSGAVTGHYTSIINPGYAYVGIGAFKPASGYGAVAGELKAGTGLDETQSGAQGAYRQKIEVQKSKLTVSAASDKTIHIGKTALLSLTAKTSYENGLGVYWSPRVADVSLLDVSWVSDNGTIATVDSAGTVTGVKAGSTSVKATYAGTEYAASITVEDHNWQQTGSQAPTCTEAGSKTYKCSGCDQTKEETIEATGHFWSAEYTVDTPATCQSAGSESIHCTVCHTSKPGTGRIIPIADHNYSDWVVTQSATCTTNGSREKTCGVCGDKITETIDAPGHSWNDKKTVDVPATCTTDGSQSCHCKNCEAVKDSEVIPARGHDWNVPTYVWSSDYKNITATRVCKNDPGHKETETVATTAKVTKAPTYTAKGQTTYTAEFANDAFAAQEKTVENIPVLPKKAQLMAVKGKQATVKYSKVRKKAQTVALSKVLTISNAQGTVTFAKASGNKKITINKSTGKVTVKKGIKKGTYKVKVKVTAAGNGNYKAVTREAIFKIKVK